LAAERDFAGEVDSRGGSVRRTGDGGAEGSPSSEGCWPRLAEN